MSQVINFIKLDFNRSNDVIIPTIEWDQGSRFVRVQLQNNNQSVDITGSQVAITVIRNDLEEIIESCNVLDAKEGLIEFEISKAMVARQGDMLCQLKLSDNDSVLSSQLFKISVNNTLTLSLEESRSEMDVLIHALGEVQDINNRFNQINAQLSTEIDIERKRIDSFVALPDGSTSGDAELIDIRIGTDNTIYPSAGEAVRSQIKNISHEVKKNDDEFVWHNLLDLNKLTQGFLDLSGKHFDATNYYYTDFIPFDSTMSIQLLRANTSNLFRATSYNQTNMRFVTTYDINKNVINASGQQNVSTYFNTNDVNVKYVRITILSGYIDDAKNNTMLTYGDTPPSSYLYTPAGYTLNNLITSNKYSNLVAKRVIVLGDSIAFGEGSGGDGIASLLAEKCGCTTKNYAVSGATVVQSSNCLLQQYDKLISDHTNGSVFLCEPDYIVFDGGANDMVTGKLSKLGDLSDYYGNTLSTDNFTGAFETLIRNLQTTFPKTKLIYFTNHHMQTRNKVNMDTYFGRAKEIMQKYGVEVVDIYSISGLNTAHGTQHAEYVPDRTHPNRKGYLKYYLPYIVNAMNNSI